MLFTRSPAFEQQLTQLIERRGGLLWVAVEDVLQDVQVVQDIEVFVAGLLGDLLKGAALGMGVRETVFVLAVLVEFVRR